MTRPNRMPAGFTMAARSSPFTPMMHMNRGLKRSCGDLNRRASTQQQVWRHPGKPSRRLRLLFMQMKRATRSSWKTPATKFTKPSRVQASSHRKTRTTRAASTNSPEFSAVATPSSLPSAVKITRVYREAYDFGYREAGKHGNARKSWVNAEPDLRRDWEKRNSNWDGVRAAVQQGWEAARGSG